MGHATVELVTVQRDELCDCADDDTVHAWETTMPTKRSSRDRGQGLKSPFDSAGVLHHGRVACCLSFERFKRLEQLSHIFVSAPRVANLRGSISNWVQIGRVRSVLIDGCTCAAIRLFNAPL